MRQNERQRYAGSKRSKRIVVWITRKGAVRLAAVAGLVALLGVLLWAEIPALETGGQGYLKTPLTGKTIALDAGHGGVDGGAVSRDGVIEKDINMALVLQLRDYLQQAGAVVYLTREGDHDLADPNVKGYSKRKTQDLLKRTALIVGKRPDIALTIHMNSVPSAKWSGAQTFYYPSNTEGGRLATLVQAEIRESVGNTNRVALTKDNVYLLKALKMPTALVEVGFLSNPNESRLLAGEGYQTKVAAALYRGILRYAEGEGKSAAPPTVN
ncbi:N-acetylmuramoyl-L-alanine amidase CwlD [Cohnella hashimotonis]|uniref:N-acetylmuramoyl-L-alanine amidase CwlD n=1 Tax=Cohnella hashimotonis TaxID=2826895 RepID=A0ABT6T9C6_9BACL|nr:N-acetylmuramoyl-L-alanine amidase CwlD [Cohnella hashimotonis]MDI4643425.1 N-acetylmuramoyl-L-alanine amidase CwlD [Cohnella hashimotonis]